MAFQAVSPSKGHCRPREIQQQQEKQQLERGHLRDGEERPNILTTERNKKVS